MTQSVPDFSELLKNTQHSASHLEMRDAYGVASEAASFEAFQKGVWTEAEEKAGRSTWLGLIADAVNRGVVLRRARIVSEPVTQYIRFEHAGTQMNIDAGEQIRWLPRRRALGIPLPAADFWLFDGRLVRFNIFTGDGDWADPRVETREDLATVKLCADAFEQVWERATPHDQYTV
ncbi:DUF6879 family protein [Streptomyces sp. CBMA123]|uniref:DUF6879 family protein n=1 Tax=Streptomyces sp. CBMA123 TaxID=1896313 RepID=UPI00166201FD|nr:DUF6879 family protein [Streptomyces sp. CBMA123]MBD0688501.1 hypothetical protein [Streptomyces sp. CBMA123]